MTYNLLIADDEYFIRKKLEKIINWEELSLNFIGEAENGQDVITMLHEKEVHILLLDIKMPIKTGLEVMEYIASHNLDTRVIILSGYSDFEYAQKALRLRAYDYLIKPIQKETLQKSLLACIKSLHQSYLNARKIQDYNHYKLKECIYNQLTTEHKGTNDNIPRLHILKNKSYFMLIGVYATAPKDYRDLFKDANLNPTPLFLSFQESHHEQIVFIAFDNREQYKDITNLCESLLKTQTQYTFLTTTTCLELTEPSWQQYYKQIKENLYKRYYTPVYTIFYSPTTVTETATYPSYFHDQLNHLVKSQDIEGVKSYINTIFNHIDDMGSRNYLTFALTDIYMILMMQFPCHFEEMTHVNNYVNHIIDEHYRLVDIKNWILEDLQMCVATTLVQNSNHACLITNMKDYLNSHYTESTLSVADLSQQFYRNANYLGSLFKKNTGQSILQYITQLRMNKAKALLSTKQYTITEIAYMVGYTDVFYFSRKFKKIFGASPKNY